jgi:hypothetical protein
MASGVGSSIESDYLRQELLQAQQVHVQEEQVRVQVATVTDDGKASESSSQSLSALLIGLT